jgi:hypothetical protein
LAQVGALQNQWWKMKQRKILKPAFGVYTHARPNGKIFYIGKGTLNRARSFSRRNAWHMNIINKHGKNNIIVSWKKQSSEKEAFKQEVFLIKHYRKLGYKIVNQTLGGEGVSGHRHSLKTKKALSKLVANLWLNPAYRTHSIAQITKIKSSKKFKKIMSNHMKRRWKNPEEKQKLINGLTGYRHTSADKLKIGKASQVSWDDSKQRVKRLRAIKKASKKVSLKIKELWKDPEYRKKTIAGRKRYFKNQVLKHA